jgi:hypothetical protein
MRTLHCFYFTFFVFFACSGVQCILCCVCSLFVIVLCTLYCQFLWIVQFYYPLRYLYFPIDGLTVSVLASRAVDCCFESRSGQTKDYKIGICCFSAKHGSLRRKSKDWFENNQRWSLRIYVSRKIVRNNPVINTN